MVAPDETSEASTKRVRRNPPRSKASASEIDKPALSKRAPRTKKTTATPKPVAAAGPSEASEGKRVTDRVAVAKKSTPPVKKVVKARETPPVAGPSSTPHAGPSQAPFRKGKGKKKAVEEESQGTGEEKRKAVFKPRCPQNILDRVERVMYQRIFMIDRTRHGDDLREEYSILGSTGNVYTVTIDNLPRCNCPDAVRGNHCKHILFVFLKVLQVSQASGLWYQKALLTNELEQIFRNAPLAPQARADSRVVAEFARATGKTPVQAEPEKSGGNKRIPEEGDDCPICYDGIHGAPEASLVFCGQCGNALHNECFGEWRKTAARNGKDLTCVWCRAAWVVPGPAGATGSAKRVQGGYLNLAGAAGLDQTRDTSSYYHGPARGERYYGYRAYND
ncbi:hypothetical protein CPB83DRAFT_773736 [Crepidotus variabilis]|uniref:Mitogen-activated protein kinase kinase kinase 1 n=1 Tax=Crepidotus variabilis TaxID=179855 RepID=A0A9P6E8Q7_9AGAR|nr:hypothetical protein CPB83DRAFT_773736 [Crepidotus variabilis]